MFQSYIHDTTSFLEHMNNPLNNKPVLHSFEFDYVKFSHAASHNDVVAVAKWVPYANVDSRLDALEKATYCGHLECVKILVKYIDPKTENSLALVSAMAGYTNHQDRSCFDFLYPLSNFEDAATWWMEIYGDAANVLLDETKAWKQKQRIEDQLPSSHLSVTKKM